MKKILCGILIICLFIVAGCQQKDVNEENMTGKVDEKMVILTNTFASYDWSKQMIAGVEDEFEVILLTKNSSDLHNYEPSVQDIAKILTADLFIYNGGASDSWVNDIDWNQGNENMIRIDMVKSIKEGFVEVIEEHEDHEDHEGDEDHGHHEGDEDHEHHEGDEDHEHHDGDKDHEHHEHADDEHIWLSLNNAELICKEINKGLTTLDSENQELYDNNLEQYVRDLETLNQKYAELFEIAHGKNMVVIDRFPFDYLIDTQLIHHKSAFEGCHAESEVSFDTVIDLSNYIEENHLKYAFVTESPNHDIVSTVLDNVKGQQPEILTLNSLQWLDIEGNYDSYYDVMSANYEVLKMGLENE